MENYMWLYIAFSYLFGFGCALVDYNRTKDLSPFLWFLLSPVAVPIALGIFTTRRA